MGNGWNRNNKILNCNPRGKDMDELKDVILRLAKAQKMPKRFKDHPLKGTLKDCRECHIEPDWLVIYRIEGGELCLVRTGTHSDLFE
ncbi:MAG: type II toxin-antitoxin system YafQ family toxin [Deltaproteobacteria bacterium]|nr:type II toxin-antitoxin system YafQ family toxin [Deltaproteobacteria bacterium]MBW2284624.1 type II toxin-antitoxin system YafQ family toxin [Deltaproteobacteria bacterium]